MFGLLGSNGAGKSTTMNIICNVLTQTEGDVFINGINLRKNPIEAKRSISVFTPEGPSSHGDDGRQYLYHCADIRLMPKKEILRLLIVQKSVESRISVSVRYVIFRGYQQRVGIAQAIIHDPLFVILDEPTNGLDPNQITEVRHLIKGIAEDRAVLISTHILPECRLFVIIS